MVEVSAQAAECGAGESLWHEVTDPVDELLCPGLTGTDASASGSPEHEHVANLDACRINTLDPFFLQADPNPVVQEGVDLISKLLLLSGISAGEIVEPKAGLTVFAFSKRLDTRTNFYGCRR